MFNAGLGFHTEKCRLGYQKPEAAGLNSLKLQAIDSIARQGLEKEAYPGCRVIVGKDGMIVYDKSFGYYDFTNKEPVTESTVYDLASVSKVIGTLPGVMLAYDEHKLSLTDRISEFIPELQQTDKQDIILRDMLYHQSGLPSVINFYEQTIDRSSYSGSLYSGRLDARHTVRYGTRTYINPNFRFLPENVSRTKREGFEVQAGRSFYLNDAFPTDSILSGVIRAKLDGAGRYRYSCVNFILLKMMIERLYGEPMDRLLDNYFYSRLGAWSMTYNPLQKYDSSYIAPTEKDVFIRRQTLRGYVHDEAAAFQGGVSGNAGLFATAGDLAKICQMYLNDGKYGGETYLSVKTCRMFTESRNSANRRGLGFDKPDVRNRSQSPCSQSAPPSVYGHTGFTGTCFWIDPDNKMFFIFLSNRTFPSRTNQKLFSLDVRKRMQEAIYNAFTQTSY